MLGGLALACALGCTRGYGEGSGETEPERAVEAEQTPKSHTTLVERPKTTRLLSVQGSAFGATLGLTDDANFLLTGTAAYRFVHGEPPARWAGDFGVAPTLTPGHIVFWSNGAFRRVPTSGGQATRIAAVPRQPRRFATSGDHLAWLEQTPSGGFSIHTLDGSRSRVVHVADGYVGMLAMEDERIYFAERAADRSWRLGLVPRSGGPAHYTKAKRGRLPAMLALAESLFYYDGPSLTLLRVSPDLDSEEIIARDIICSPLAVAKNVYCAQPAGLVEVGLEGGVLRTIPLDNHGAITALGATATQLMWVTDTGDGQLAVDSMSLTAKDGVTRAEGIN